MKAAAGPARRGPGHPPGLWFLAFTETWERFSYYGMAGLLVLYMVQSLLPGGELVLGLAAVRRVLQPSGGSDQAFASAIYGFYTGSVYLAAVAGGLVADRLLGARRAVVLGALLLAAGHLAMAFAQSFVIAILLLIAGTGLLKGNISGQVGALYPREAEDARGRGIVIFSTGINVGATAGPLGCGLLAQIYGWHAGFAMAAALMLVGLATYLAGLRYYAPDPPRRDRTARAPLTRDERLRCLVLTAIGLATVPITASYYQISNAGLMWIAAHCDLATPLGKVPVPWFSSVDAFSSIVAAPLLLALLARRAAVGRAVEPLAQMTMGGALMGAAWLFLAVPALLWPAGPVSALWPFAGFTLMGVAFMLYWPQLLAGLAPERVRGLMMGVTF